MASLRRDEAVTRATLITVESMQVELDLTGAERAETFRSTSTIRFRASRTGAETFLDVDCREWVGGTLNGQAVETSPVDGRLVLGGLAEQNELVVSAEMAYSADGEGLHRHVDPADGQTYLYAMSFLDAAPRWFGCFDQPDLKAPYVLQVRVPEDWSVYGNGPARPEAPGLVRIEQPRPLATYFVTLVVGPWVSVLDSHDGIALGVHAKASLAESLRREAADILQVTRSCFDAYHQLFGVRYPFGEYHQAFVPDFNAGAMENPGCVTLRDQMVFTGAAGDFERASRAGTVAHELAHMWFGNLVTMRWWDDLWLNESFAEYLAQRVCDQVTRYDAWSDFGIVRKAWGSVADQAPSTHPVAGNGSADAAEALSQFDGISYAKGAALLKQLVAFLGEEVFFAGLRDHFERHAFGNAELADLMASWTRAGAVGLQGWQQGWLQTSGMDRLEVGSGSQGIQLVRVPPPGSSADRTHAVQVAAFDHSGAEVQRVRLEVGAAPVPIDLPSGHLVVPDVEDESWARVRLAEGWDDLAALSTLSSPAARIMIWNSVRDGVLSAELDPARALALATVQLAGESSDVVVRTVLAVATHTWAAAFTPQPDRAAAHAGLAELTERLLSGSAPGSDRRLLAWRALIEVSTEVGRLRGWLEGADLPAGSTLDEDLSWRLAVRLSTLGHPEVAEPTLRRYPTALGRAQAVRCRASAPTDEAKQWAFEVVTQPSGLSAYEVYAVADGLFPPEQDELTRPWASRWFEAIEQTGRFRSGWALSTAVTRSFPGGHVAAETLEGVRGLLGCPGLDAAVRRPLLDQGDVMERALVSLQRFPLG